MSRITTLHRWFQGATTRTAKGPAGQRPHDPLALRLERYVWAARHLDDLPNRPKP